MHTNYSSEAFALITQFGTQSLVDDLVKKFKQKANKNEDVTVTVWCGENIYIEVSNRYMEYPTKIRALITVDAVTGKAKRAHSSEEHSFVRKGWKALVSGLIGDVSVCAG